MGQIENLEIKVLKHKVVNLRDNLASVIPLIDWITTNTQFSRLTPEEQNKILQISNTSKKAVELSQDVAI